MNKGRTWLSYKVASREEMGYWLDNDHGRSPHTTEQRILGCLQRIADVLDPPGVDYDHLHRRAMKCLETRIRRSKVKFKEQQKDSAVWSLAAAFVMNARHQKHKCWYPWDIDLRATEGMRLSKVVCKLLAKVADVEDAKAAAKASRRKS